MTHLHVTPAIHTLELVCIETWVHIGKVTDGIQNIHMRMYNKIHTPDEQTQPLSDLKTTWLNQLSESKL